MDSNAAFEQSQMMRRGAMRAARMLAISAIVFCQFAGAARAADIQFDEPFEGRTRACAAKVCVDSPSATVSRSLSGSISPVDLFGALDPALLPFASLVSLQGYQTNQTLNLNLLDGQGTVVNTLDVDFDVAQLQYTLAFLFRSDSAGPLANGPGVDVLATGGYQDVTPFLQSQLDLGGLPFPFGALATFFQPEFFPISVAIRTGPIEVIGAPGAVPEPGTPLLLLGGSLAFAFVGTRNRHRVPKEGDSAPSKVVRN